LRDILGDSDAEESKLLQACTSKGQVLARTNGSPVSTATVAPYVPDYLNNAKFEGISCKPIKPIYNGTKVDLMPFLLCLDICHQDQGWASATYLTIDDKKYDLTSEFASITEATVIAAVHSHRWQSPTMQTDQHTIGHDTFHAR
jgi:hypothetical protein